MNTHPGTHDECSLLAEKISSEREAMRLGEE